MAEFTSPITEGDNEDPQAKVSFMQYGATYFYKGITHETDSGEFVRSLGCKAGEPLKFSLVRSVAILNNKDFKRSTGSLDW